MAPGSPPAGFPEAGGGFPGERSPASPPPEFFGQGQGYGQQDPNGYGQQEPNGSGGYPQRTPGRSLHDLPQRGTTAQGGYGQDDSFGRDPGFGRDNGFGRDPGFGQESGYGQDNSFGQNGGFGQDNGYGQESAYGSQESAYGGQEGAYGGQDWGAADQADSWGGARTVGRPGVPWDDRGQRDPGYQDPDGGFGRQDPGRGGYAAQDYAGQDYAAQDYPGQSGYGQQLGGPQEPSPYARGERDSAARSDPALQDFFAPQSGQSGPSGYGQQLGGGSDFPREPRYRQDDDGGWGGWDGPQQQPPRTGTGPSPVPRAPRSGGGGGGGNDRRGLGLRGILVIGVVVAVIIVAAVVLLGKKSGGKTPTAGNTPAGTTTSAAAKPSASKAGGAAAGTAYTLSTPATAGGYPKGTDPKFLQIAVATATQIVTSVKSGGGGTAEGMTVSSPYTLPLNQVITFVGYQGTFTPAKVATILTKLGSDPHTYPAGPHGGILGCANAPATATVTSGAVCVWATTSTLGITEFFDSTGPEALTTSQSKGATDTVNLRADVEAKKS